MSRLSILSTLCKLWLVCVCVREREREREREKEEEEERVDNLLEWKRGKNDRWTTPVLQKENVLVFVFLRENCFLFFVPQEVCRLRASFLSFLSFSCNNCVAISVQFQKKQGNPDERTRAKKKKKRGCNFFELWNKKKSAWRASELAGILIGMPALTYFLWRIFFFVRREDDRVAESILLPRCCSDVPDFTVSHRCVSNISCSVVITKQVLLVVVVSSLGSRCVNNVDEICSRKQTLDLRRKSALFGALWCLVMSDHVRPIILSCLVMSDPSSMFWLLWSLILFLGELTDQGPGRRAHTNGSSTTGWWCAIYGQWVHGGGLRRWCWGFTASNLRENFIWHWLRQWEWCGEGEAKPYLVLSKACFGSSTWLLAGCLLSYFILPSASLIAACVWGFCQKVGFLHDQTLVLYFVCFRKGIMVATT